jgi:hypothetical protein
MASLAYESRVSIDTTASTDAATGKGRSIDSTYASSANSTRVSTRSNFRRTEEGRSIGQLLYQLRGLLCLQSLLALAFEENRFLKSRISKLENLSGNTKQTDDEGRNDSLLSSAWRSTQLQLSKLQTMMTGMEGNSATDVTKQTCTCQYQQSVIEDLQRQLSEYHQSMPHKSSSIQAGSLEKSIIKSLSEHERVVAVERTLSRELGLRLEQRNSELESLRRQLDLERYGRQRSQSLLRDILNDFIACCLQTQPVSQNSELRLAFEDLVRKSDLLTAEFREDFRAATEVVCDHSNDDFLRSEIDMNEANADDLKAGEKIRQLEDQLKQLRKEAKSNIIEQMRKHKLVEIKIPASDDM